VIDDARGARPAVPWALWTLGALALASHAMLLGGLDLGAWLLPGAALLALALRRPRIPPIRGRLPAAVLAVAASSIAVGSVATLDRSWDGYATWSLMARWLGEHGTLAQPYFADPAVYNYGRGYPLLQPVLLAQTSAWLGDHGGRLLFPALWLFLVTGIAEPLRRAGASPRTSAITVLGLALVPIFVETGSGSAESGFADLLVAGLALHLAIAIVGDAFGLALATCLLLPLAKNEGVIHVLLGLGIAAVAGRRRAASGAATGATLGLLIWLPLQQRLLAPGGDPTVGLATFAPAAVPAVVCAFGLAFHHPRWRWPAFGLALIAPAALAFGGAFAASPIGQTLRSIARLELAWSSLPTIGLAGLANLVFVRKLGLTFVILAVAMLVALRRRRLGAATPLCALLLLAGAAIATFLATRPAAELELFLDEGLVRYTAQWIGVAWLAIGLLLVELERAPDPAPGSGNPT
jgi:hypothetical protein